MNYSDCAVSYEYNEQWFTEYMSRSNPVRKRIEEMNAKFFELHEGIKEAIQNGDRKKAENLSAEIAIVRDLLKTLHNIHMDCL